MKNILITGASGGIGSEIAKTLASKSTRLLLVYHSNYNNVKKLSEQLFNKCEGVVFKCNLTNEKEICDLVENILKKYKHIDGLVNCAGISKFQQIQDTTESDYLQVFDTNVKSTILLTSKVSKNMISNQYGRIINISSMWGVVGSSMESVYSASKGAINALTLSLAKELGPSNITVNAICPGLIDTNMNKSLSKETIAEIVENTPITRIGKPKDVANMVKFLLSKDADFVTGQIINVDGGYGL